MVIDQGNLANPVVNTPSAEIAVVEDYQNKIWSKFIPITNRIFMILSLLLVFGLDLLILVTSSSSFEFYLLPFWIEMLIILGLFTLFYFFENRLLSKRLADSESALDLLIFFAVVVRNIIIFLNFIPFIQLLGIIIGMYAGIPYLIVYAIIIALRYKKVQVH